MRILFVCKHNRFRSKIAEAIFKDLNRNKTIKASSAGIIAGQPISKQITNVAKKHGVKIRGQPRFISSKLLKNQDIIVNVADNVPSKIFKGYKDYKIFTWNIRDVKNSNKSYDKLAGAQIEKIRKKVNILIKNLKK